MKDADIRSKLCKVLIRQFYGLNPEVIPELGLAEGQCRADVAVVSNQNFYGFEIKSDEDVLKRLNRQVRFYSEVMDYASVVTTAKWIDEVESLIPKWWGLYLASNDFGPVSISVRRQPKRNPKINRDQLTSMIWKDEAIDFLERKGQAAGLYSKAKRHAWDRIKKVYTLDEIRSYVRERIRERAKMVPGWKARRIRRKRRELQSQRTRKRMAVL